MKTNMGKSYSGFLSLDEMRYKLFSKKICPKCGGKMISEHKEEYVGTGPAQNSRMIYEAEIYRLIQCYRCKSCDNVYTISELIE